MKLFAASADGTKIAYERLGQGNTVLLILGALNSRKSGIRLGKLLTPKFSVISYDRRGRGDSTDTAPYSPQREVEDIVAISDAVGEPICIYGHSSGAALALEATNKLRKQVRKLAIYEAPYCLDNDACRAASQYYTTLKKLLASGRRGDAVALFVRSVGVSDKQIQAMRRLPMWRGLERLAPTLIYDSEVLGNGHSLPSALLSQIPTPTLVMHGGAGALTLRDVAEEISKVMPKARLRTLEGQTHGVSPKVLAPVLQEFFS